MTIGLILTLIFLVLEVTNQIDWAWWQIVLPLLIELGATLVFFALFMVGAVHVNRKAAR